MVTNDIILKSIDDAIEKCHNYPKAVALKNFNESDYLTESYPTGVNTEELPSPVGRLQKLQADAQEEIEYESLERGVLRDYSTNSFIPVNMYLNEVDDWIDKCDSILYNIKGRNVMPVLDSPNNDGRGDWVDFTVPQEVEYLDRVMDKSPRVQVDSVVYRYGELPSDIQVGEHGRFKGFISTSYNEWVAHKDIVEGGTWVRNPMWKNGVRYKQRIFVPTGTKGVVLNKHTGCMDWQSELLIDRNQRYVVLGIDNENMTADILLY